MAEPQRIRALVGLFIFGVLSCLSGTSCSTPEARFHTLSFFFDGVPEPEAAKQEAATAPTPDSLPAAPPEKEFSVHPPYAERKCEVCHESQGSNQLKMEKSKVCATCHTAELFTGKSVHGPVAGGNCYACHDPHKSPSPHLLLEEGSSICQKCHKPEDFGEQDGHRKEKRDDCLECHKPHASDKDQLLK